VIAGGALLVVDREGRVYALDPATGSPRVEQPLELGDDVLADPLVVRNATTGKDEVLLVTSKGDLVFIDPVELDEVDRLALAGN
jgi:outer membrane protein assembly factor BamB